MRPTKTPSDYSALIRGVVAEVAWGRMTASEAATALQERPETIRRLCRAWWRIEPRRARAAHLRKLLSEAAGEHRQARIAAQMRQAAAEIEAKRAAPDTAP